MSARQAEIAFSTLLIVCCGYFIHVATGFRNSTALAGEQVRTEAFPILMLALVALFSVLNIIKVALVKGAAETEGGAFGARMLVNVALTVAALVGAVLLWPVLGFIPVAAGLAMIIAAIMGARSPVTFAGLAVFAGLLWLAFRHGLDIRL